MRVLKLIAALCAFTLATSARAQDDAPQLMLDPGGHMAIVQGLAFTSDGRQLVSAGDDKVIRVWDWREGKTVRIIRGQVGPGDDGKIYAMALSPDNRWLAVGGFLTRESGTVGNIRLYDFPSGKLVTLLKGHTNTISSLAFSADSSRLVSGSSDNTAIVWDVAGARLLHRLKGHAGDVNTVAFNRDGTRIATASDDHDVRLWNSDGRFLSVLRGHTGKIMAVAFSPIEDSLVSTGWDQTLKFWSADGRLSRSIDLDCGWGLSYTHDGRLIVCSEGHVVDARTGEKQVEHAPSSGRRVAISPDSRLAATVNKNDGIEIWAIRSARVEKVLQGPGLDVWSLGFSEDGCDLAWGNTLKRGDKENDRGDLEREVRLPCRTRPLGAPRALSRPISAYSKPVTSFDGNELVLDGPNSSNMRFLHVRRGATTMLTLNARRHGFRHQVYGFTPDGKFVLSGGANGHLTAYSIPRGEAEAFIGHVGYVFAMAVSPNGQIVASGAGDKTINIWNLKTRELIVTLFHGSDGEWVMWTPQGYYTSSPNGDKIVGWQINKGADQAAEYVTANQLRDHFYRPDIVERSIILGSARAAVMEGHGTEFSLADLLRRKPPKFDVVSPQHKSRARTNSVQVQLMFEDNAEPVQEIEVLVNGRQVTSARARNIGAQQPSTQPGPERSVEVPLEQGENNIRIVARNKVGQTSRELILLRELIEPQEKRGTLHILAIGVDRYDQLPPTCGPSRDQSCDLRFAGRDARAFRDVLARRVGPLYSAVRATLLTQDGDKLPTKAIIEDALEEMSANAGQEDTTVLFIAGHGVSEGRSGEYLFLPEGTELVGQGFRKSTVVPWNTFQGALHKTPGRRLMFADTCHSGGAYNARLVNDAANAEIVVFSATDAGTLSWEFAELQHGAFTYALIQGLEGKAGRRDGTVTVLGLGEYVSEDVTVRTQERQQPTFNISGAKNFVLARK